MNASSLAIRLSSSRDVCCARSTLLHAVVLLEDYNDKSAIRYTIDGERNQLRNVRKHAARLKAMHSCPSEAQKAVSHIGASQLRRRLTADSNFARLERQNAGGQLGPEIWSNDLGSALR